jgi:transposase
MFIRVKTTPNSPRKYVQIVQSVRKGDKVSQKILRHIGYALDDKELEQLKSLAESIKLKLESDNQQFLISPEEMADAKAKNKSFRKYQPLKDRDAYNVNLKDLVEEDRMVSGIHDIYGTLFDEMGFKYVFPNPARNQMVVNIFRDIVLARVANPISKRATVDMLEEDFGVSIPLHKVYRMMDKLGDTEIERLNKLTYKKTMGLYREKLDVVFYDCTTLYFESFTEDDFKRCGYSKDFKFSQPQVLFALLVTKDGLPVGYRAFEGNKYEGHTLIPVLEELRERYRIDRVVFVADSAMLSSINLTELEKRGFDYIVGARLKNLDSTLKEEILTRDRYKEIERGNLVSEFKYKGDLRLVVSYKDDRARKDRTDRERSINRLMKKLSRSKSQKEYFSNYGYKKYLRVIGDSQIELDTEKIKEAGRWDGLHGVVSNNKDFSAEELLRYYGQLWLVEDSFRITKHDLKVRPIFHWTSHRIKVHLAISYAAFALVRYMEHRVKLQYKKLSPEKIRQYLIRVQTSVLYDRKRKIRYSFPSKISQESRRIYSIFRQKRALTPRLMEKNVVPGKKWKP